MKINNVETIIDENGYARIIAFKQDQKLEIGCIKSGWTNASELHELVNEFLATNDYQIVSLKDDEIYDQKADLKLVRTKMRSALLKLDNKDIPLNERKELLPIYSQMCSASQVMLNACKLEVALCQLQKGKK